MDNNILNKLRTDNLHLDGLTKAYFIYVAHLTEPVLGNTSFTYVKNDFLYALREYSITHSHVIEPYESPSCRKLLRLNNIPVCLLRSYTKSVNLILESYTDKKWRRVKQHKILKEQLTNLADESQDDNTLERKMYERLNNIDPFDARTTRFLNDILKEMTKAGLNQVKDDRYIIVDKLVKLYQDMTSFLDLCTFKEKKKYLKKLHMDKAIIKLHEYIKFMLEDGYIENSTDIKDKEHNKSLINHVRWFLFYLIYDANKIDIFLVHSILGYKYEGAVKVYQKLFLKDNTTGSNKDFLHHTDVLNISQNSVYDRTHEAKYDKWLNDLAKLKELKNDSTYKDILEEKMYAYSSLYKQILTSMKN